jgi:Subtilisin inhibitor-like
MRWAVIAAVVAAASLGCGSASSAPSESMAAEPTTELSVAFFPEGRGEGGAKRWTLRCDPVGGTHTRRATACTRLLRMQRPFAVPKDPEVCTQVYGGPDQAVVSGEHRGNRVWIVLSLSDGCKIARFKQLEFLVPGLQVSAGGITR